MNDSIFTVSQSILYHVNGGINLNTKTVIPCDFLINIYKFFCTSEVIKIPYTLFQKIYVQKLFAFIVINLLYHS
jgi:hypothetical protein